MWEDTNTSDTINLFRYHNFAHLKDLAAFCDNIEQVPGHNEILDQIVREYQRNILEASDNVINLRILMSPATVVRRYVRDRKLQVFWFRKQTKDGIEVPVFILTHTVYILLFAPVNWDAERPFSAETVAYPHRYPSPKIYGWAARLKVSGVCSLEDLHRAVTLFLHTQDRRLNNRNVLASKMPPKSNDAFQGYWDPHDRQRIVELPQRHPSITNCNIRAAVRLDGKLRILLTEAEGEVSELSDLTIPLGLHTTAFRYIVKASHPDLCGQKLSDLDVEDSDYTDDEMFETIFRAVTRVHRSLLLDETTTRHAVLYDLQRFPNAKVITYNLGLSVLTRRAYDKFAQS
ncbi:hypothetical protein PT974_01668 [Cladobotryum mycophilum]|uniref:Uncharacterized protein n=1 Tax=Cladobotryum mycophilum TaxID=491253 RepID=A0ABR0T5G5_9HYPO